MCHFHPACSFGVIGTPYGLHHCVQCTECYCGIHSSCLGENAPVFVALYAKQLSVGTWNFHQVYPVPLRLGLVLLLFFIFGTPFIKALMFSRSQQEMKPRQRVMWSVSCRKSTTNFTRNVNFLGSYMTRSPQTCTLIMLKERVFFGVLSCLFLCF